MVISGVISRVTIIITHIRGLTTLLITTLKPHKTLQNTIEPLKEPL